MLPKELRDLLRKSPKSMFRADADAFTHWAAMLDMPEEVHHAERAFRFMETQGLEPLRVRDEVMASSPSEKNHSKEAFRFIDLFAGLFLVAVCQVDLDVFADVNAFDAGVAHVLEGVLDGLALRIENRLLWGDDDFSLHERSVRPFAGERSLADGAIASQS